MADKAVAKLVKGGWNYRIFHRQVPIPTTTDSVDEYVIREAYYDEDGNVTGWAEEPCFPCGDSRYDLVKDLQTMMEAIHKPVVELNAAGDALA